MSRQVNKIVNCDNKSERIVSLQLKYVSRSLLVEETLNQTLL